MYAELRQSEPTGASDIYFELGERRSQRLTPNGVEFCIDVEHATTKALEGNPALMDVWKKLLTGDSGVEIDTATTVRINAAIKNNERLRTITGGAGGNAKTSGCGATVVSICA